ncbi:MAG: sporulation protein YunB [Eubacteriales bacterium]
MPFNFRIRINKKIIITLILISVIVLLYIIDASVKPGIFALTETKLKSLAVNAMNESIKDITKDLEYSDFINIEKDNEGQINLILANSVKMNEVSSSIALDTQQRIEELGTQGIDLPIGSILGGSFFSGRGPNINIKFEPIGVATSKFYSDFESAGINQTRHCIYIDVETTFKIIVGNSSQEVSTKSEMLILETIIVGKVPETYLQADRDELMNLIPQ